MKTTKLLIGALAAMSFAACQNEALVAEQPSKAEGRAQIDVKIVPTQGVDSRMLNNNGTFSWETTDKLGAAMVDPATEGTIVDDAHFGNALFNYADGEFTTASTLSVGAYLFYYPYDAKNTTSRGGVNVKPLGAQKFDATGEEMMKNNFMVAPIAQLGGAEAGELTLPMTFRSIYGYGKLTLTNKSKNDEFDPQALEIQKIVIENTDGFVLGGTLTPATIKNATATKNLYVDLRDEDADASALFAKADAVYLDKVVDGETIKPAPVQWNTSATTGAVSIDCLTGTKGIEVAAGESVTTRVLIPAGVYDMDNITITVYTTVGYFTLDADAITTADNAGEFVVRNSRVKTIAAEITGTAESLNGEVINIVSKNDFIATMKQFVNEKNAAIKVKMNGDVAVDADMLAAIPTTKDQTFTFVNGATIEANKTLKKVNFEGGKVTIKGNVTIAGEANFNNASEVVVESGSLTIAKDVITKSIEVKKDATLNLNPGVVVASDFVDFAGTLNVGEAASRAATEPEAVTITSTVQIKLVSGTVNINAPLTLNNSIVLGESGDDAKALAAVVNYGLNKTMYVRESATMENNTTLSVNTNTGVINNNEDLTITSENSGEINNAAEAELTVEKNTGVINNSGIATVDTNDGEDAVINQILATSKLIVNTNSNKATVETTVAGSTTTVNSNSANVVYVEEALLAINASTDTGYVVYEMSDFNADKIAALKTIITKLVVTADCTLAADKETPTPYSLPTNIKAVAFEGDATFNRPIVSTAALSFEFYGNVNFAKGATLDATEMTFDGGKNLKGSAITASALTWNINNGYMKNYCKVTVTDAWNVTFGAENEEEGILAGTIWNDSETCTAGTFTATPAISWTGQAVN